MFLIRPNIFRATPRRISAGLSFQRQMKSLAFHHLQSSLSAGLFMLSTLKCDSKLHRGETQEEPSFSLSWRGCSVLPPKNFAGLCRGSGSAVFVYGNLICMCAPRLFLIFFCLPGIFPRMSPHPACSARLKILLPHRSTGHCFAFNFSFWLLFFSFHCCGNQIPAAKFLSPSHSGQ